MKLVTAAQMQTLDRKTIEEYKIPGIVLMENAGRGTVEAIKKKFGDPAGKVVSIFVGPGNNGGDGLVIARLLHQLGGNPQVFLLVEPQKLQGDAGMNLEIVQNLPIAVHSLLQTVDIKSYNFSDTRSWLAVDSIFGTGLTREVTGHFAEAIKVINDIPCQVLAVDIPSGMSSDTGQELGCCVKADLTVTFGLAKPGQISIPGRDFIGHLEVIDIGIPSQAVEDSLIQLELLDTDVGRLLPERPPDSHKGTYGHLLIMAGSIGKTGAAMLSAMGALRCGTGLVSLCVPYDLNSIFEQRLCEAMTIPVPSSEHLSIDDYCELETAMIGKQAAALGPGLGLATETGELVLKLYTESVLPMVVDADGLNLLANNPVIIKNPNAPRILTPHPGEMSRLTGTSTKDIQNNRISVTQNYARENLVVVVLKGADTVIAAPDGRTAINPTGNPGMAAGGMGDVLTGLIGGFLAQGLSPWDAACLGVYVHGFAGDKLAAANNDFAMGYLASEVADELPVALSELRNHHK